MFKFNLKIILYVIGILLAFNGGLMLLSALISLLMKDGVSFEITLSAITVMGMGASMVLVFRNHHANIQKREGYLIVTIGWLLMAVTGMLPFWPRVRLTQFMMLFLRPCLDIQQQAQLL